MLLDTGTEESFFTSLEPSLAPSSILNYQALHRMVHFFPKDPGASQSQEISCGKFIAAHSVLLGGTLPRLLLPLHTPWLSTP